MLETFHSYFLLPNLLVDWRDLALTMKMNYPWQFIPQAVTDLHTLFLENGIVKLSSESFREDAHAQVENMKVTYHKSNNF